MRWLLRTRVINICMGLLNVQSEEVQCLWNAPDMDSFPLAVAARLEGDGVRGRVVFLPGQVPCGYPLTCPACYGPWGRL